MAMYSTGGAAAKLEMTRDALQYYLRTGAPNVGQRCGRRRMFTEADLDTLRTWFSKHTRRRCRCESE